jgi:hypothetical protein
MAPKVDNPTPQGAATPGTDPARPSLVIQAVKEARSWLSGGAPAWDASALNSLDRPKSGRCPTNASGMEVVIYFVANGQKACDLVDVPEGARIVARVLLRCGWLGEYSITAEKGKTSSHLIRGATSPDVSAPKSAAALAQPDAICYQQQLLGPYDSDTVSITVADALNSITVKTDVTIAARYVFNMAALALVGPARTTYSITNGAIAQSKEDVALDYFIGIHWYPFAWRTVYRAESDGGTQVANGRYFSFRYDNPWDYIAVVVGASISDPLKAGYLGLAIGPFAGFALTAGFQPRKEQSLQPGNAVGDKFTGSNAPVDDLWKSEWGIGISVDASIAKAISGALK